MIRIGTSLTSNYGPRTPARAGAAHMVACAAAARAAGLDSLFVGDHHNNGPALYYQNVPIMGRLLAEWGEQPAGILALLPLWNATLLAEHVGTLAAIAPGRFILQCSLGDEPHQFTALGADIAQRVPRFREVLTTVQALLRGEEVGGVRVAPVPEEPVEYWVGAMADAGLRRAARLADGWLASPGVPVALLREKAARYQEACAAAGRPPRAVATRRDIFVGADGDHARAATAATLARGYRGFDPSVLIIGGPHEVAERLAEVAAAGFTDVIVRHVHAEPEEIVASLYRLGEVRTLLGAG